MSFVEGVAEGKLNANMGAKSRKVANMIEAALFVKCRFKSYIEDLAGFSRLHNRPVTKLKSWQSQPGSDKRVPLGPLLLSSRGGKLVLRLRSKT
jgi:hypothetical protein